MQILIKEGISELNNQSSEIYFKGNTHTYGDVTVINGGGNSMKITVENYFNNNISTTLNFDFNNISKVKDQLGSSASSALVVR